MTSESIEFRLSGTGAPDGMLDAEALADLLQNLHELSMRVGRWVVEGSGPGRTPVLIEKLTALRVTGLAPGSTRILLERGSAEGIGISDGLETEVDARFWQVLEGVAHDRPTADSPQVVRDSARGVLDALDRSSQMVTVIGRGGHHVSFEPKRRDRTVWLPGRSAGAAVTVSGILEMVDLARGRFRLRDDAGNSIHLEKVTHPRDHLVLIDKRALATGALETNGRTKTLVAPQIEPAPDLALAMPSEVLDLAQFAEQPGPILIGGSDLDDDEWAQFLTAALGA